MFKAELIDVTGGVWKSNGTTSMPKSVPHLVVDTAQACNIDILLMECMLPHSDCVFETMKYFSGFFYLLGKFLIFIMQILIKTC